MFSQPDSLIEQLNRAVEQYAQLLTAPAHQDLAEQLDNIRALLQQIIDLEERAITSPDLNTGFAAQELVERVQIEIEQLSENLKIAESSGWTKFERYLFGGYTQDEIEELQALMTRWSLGTYSSITESIIDHALRKGYETNFLHYLRAASSFDKTKAVRIPRSGFRDDDTVRWENKKTGEYLIEDDLGKIRSYGIN